MINALSPALIVRWLSLLFVAAASASLITSSPSDASQLWSARGTILGAVNAVIFALTFRWVFLRAYKLVHAERWWFPLIDGEWRGELRSNWPRVRAMMLAAKGEAPPFDALSDEVPGGGEQVTDLEATITCSLFEILMEIRIRGTERTSRTIFVRPQWCKPAAPQITYVYDQVDHGAVAVTDAPRHKGAAVLEYDRTTGELRGEYWTNRQGPRGLNTAGSVIFRRAK